MEKGMCLFEIINFHFPRIFFKATSLIHGLFSIKVQRFVSISTSTKKSTVNSSAIGSVAKKKHGLPRCFGSTELHIIMEGLMAWPSKKNGTEKTPTRRISWFRETLYPWRIWSTHDPMPTYTSQDAEKDLKLSEWNIANFMEMKTLSHNGFSNNLKHVANSKEKQRSCRWCSVIRHKSSSPPRNDT